MKRLLMLSLMVFGLFNQALTQDTKEQFTISVSSDSVLLGNYFIVRFTLQNVEGINFTPPSFEGFDVVSGPNQSSEFSMINGDVTQKMTYAYYLKPRDIGNYYITPASIETPDAVLESQPTAILVLPNPDGIIQNPETPIEQNFFDNNDFFNLDFGNFDSFFFPESNKNLPKKDKEEKPKRKRKVYKM